MVQNFHLSERITNNILKAEKRRPFQVLCKR